MEASFNMMNGKTETGLELVAQLKAGSDEAFAQLYDDYSALIFGTILRIVGNRNDAENLLQECFVKIWKHIDTYDPHKSRFATWLINIARNTGIDFTRSKYFSQMRKNQSVQDLELAERSSAAADSFVDAIGLRQLLDKLTPDCRAVLEWMYFEGYTQKDISENFNIPLGTVKSRTRKGLKELRVFFNLEKRDRF